MNTPSKSLVYLAVPYSHPDCAVREQRFRAANVAAARLMRSGALVFSPISHGHPIAQAGGLPTDWRYWETYCRAVMSACRCVVVLMCDGWRESTGVTAEIDIAKQLGLPVSYMDCVPPEI